MSPAANLIEDLVGHELSAVSFVRDYVELHFDGAILRSFSRPLVHSCERGRNGRSWRDELCDFIGRVVTTATIVPGEVISLAFGEDALSVPIGADEHIGPEAAHFMPGNGQGMLVW